MLRIVVYLIIGFDLICTGCVSNSSDPLAAEKIKAVSIIGPDYRKLGNIPYDSLDQKLRSTTGCVVAYTYYKPRGASKDVLVVLGHGFMRSKKRMARLAQHLASWGLSVVSMEFCNSKLWAGRHNLNGADMVAVTQKIPVESVIYTGFSAGGLAAMVAADLDNNALAYFGLDLVDNKGLGSKMAPGLTIPFYGLIAAPSSCNAHNNGLDAYAQAPHSKVIKVEDTSHCHFELPVDGKCSLVCGKGERQFSRGTLQETIFGLTTAFLLWQSGLDTRGQTWWFDDQPNYVALRDAGYITIPTSNWRRKR